MPPAAPFGYVGSPSRPLLLLLTLQPPTATICASPTRRRLTPAPALTTPQTTGAPHHALKAERDGTRRLMPPAYRPPTSEAISAGPTSASLRSDQQQAAAATLRQNVVCRSGEGYCSTSSHTRQRPPAPTLPHHGLTSERVRLPSRRSKADGRSIPDARARSCA